MIVGGKGYQCCRFMVGFGGSTTCDGESCRLGVVGVPRGCWGWGLEEGATFVVIKVRSRGTQDSHQ